MHTKKMVVTGGAGFIGSHVADALIEQGYDVHVVDSLIQGKKERISEKAVFHNVDILDTKKLNTIFEGVDTVFHLAALPRVPFSIDHPKESHDANINGTLSVLLAAKESGVRRVVYSASSSAYGNQATLPLTEDMFPEPLHPYGLQKYVGEWYATLFAQLYGVQTVSLRYFNVYGPRLDPDGAYALVIGKFLKQRTHNEPLTIVGDGTQTRDYTHVKDVVRANILASESSRVGKGEVINIGCGRNISINMLCDLIGGERTHLPARVEAHDSLADITKAKELLGWEPSISLEEGIAQLKEEWGIV